MNKNKKVYVDINNAHTDDMVKVLQKIIDDGVDPFSLEYMHKYHGKPILKVATHWYVTESKWIYPNAKNHLLFVTIRYVESIIELKPDDIVEFLSLIDEFSTEYGIKGGAVCMRFGETSLTGATVKHLHAHLFEADMEKGSVTFPVGRKKR